MVVSALLFWTNQDFPTPVSDTDGSRRWNQTSGLQKNVSSKKKNCESDVTDAPYMFSFSLWMDQMNCSNQTVKTFTSTEPTVKCPELCPSSAPLLHKLELMLISLIFNILKVNRKLNNVIKIFVHAIKIWPFQFTKSILACQNLAPTLPTMQLDRWQFSRRFWCVMLVAANVAWSC